MEAKPKEAMTNVDVAALAAELRPQVEGSRIDRVYQPSKERILLKLRKTGAGRTDLLCHLGRFLTATRRAPANPERPSMLAQVLRTALENGRVTAFGQVGFDRILKLTVERGDGVRHIVIELFGEGNFILLNEAGVIQLPMRAEEFVARRLRKGEPYQGPPASPDPFLLTRVALEEGAQKASRDVVRWIAGDLGFGPLWGEELCLRAGIDKRTAPALLGPPQWDALHEAIQALGRDLRSGLVAPELVHAVGPAGPVLVDALPFPMQRYQATGFAHEEAPTFHDALDRFFVGTEMDDEPEDPRRPRYDAARGKLQRQIDQTTEAMERLALEEREGQVRGEAVYASFGLLKALVDDLAQARREGGWSAAQRLIDEKRGPWTALVEELHPHEGRARLRLPGGEGPIELSADVRLDPQGMAQGEFEAAKKARSRREGAARALGEARERLAELERVGLDGFGPPAARATVTRHHFWFEPYRWTLTPSGLLAVGGRNAAQNDAVVKKYLRDGDRYVHADIHGAPSVVVRSVDGTTPEVPAADLEVAAQFAACASRAWRLGVAASAYWVTPQQVSKTPQSGEFVPRGAWIIHGRRNTIDHIAMDWWVGPLFFTPAGKPVAAGEPGAVRKVCGGPRAGLLPFGAAVVHLVPGSGDPNAVAVDLAARFGVSVEEAAAALPPGPMEVVGGAP
ncbi:MAG: ribosome rescue protein RqcH [Thermoplasmatota archaeon]